MACVQIVLLSTVELLKPWPLKLIIDHVLGGHTMAWPFLAGWSPEALLCLACVALVAIHALVGGPHLLTNSTQHRIGHGIVMEGLEQLMGSRTTFIVAHRLSTVQRADVIVVMQEGRIVEQGTYAELMRRQGLFAMLYHTQFAGTEAIHSQDAAMTQSLAAS